MLSNESNDQDNIKSSVENTADDLKKSERTVEVQGTTFTEKEIEEANKPQRNVILNTVGGSGISGTSETDTDYRDNERVNTRANEAPDSTDTNTGGLSSGGAKGASQS